MIFVYDKKSTAEQLQTNGQSRVEAVSCTVFERINSEFYAEISVPVGAEGSAFCTIGAILRIACHRGLQFFRIWSADQDNDKIKIKAWHISYDLSAALVVSASFSAASGQDALTGLLTAATTETRFSGASEIDTANNITVVRGSVLSALINTKIENCYLNIWGGEVERDNFNFNVKTSLGADLGVRISYKKNLTGFKMTEDASDLATRIFPTCLSSDDTVLPLPEGYIDSAYIDDYAVPYVRTIHFSDIVVGKTVEGNIPYPDAASAYAEMRAKVAALYAAKCDLPLLTASIDLVLIGATTEYAEYADLESVSLGDTIVGNYRNVSVTNRVHEITYDAFSKRVTKILLGSASRNTIADTMYAQDVDLSALKSDMDETLKQTGSYYGCGINHQDGFICTAEDGHFSKFNADTMGFFNSAGAQVGGISYINSVLAFVSSMLTNDATDPTFWATVGEVTEGTIKRGILGFAKEYSTTKSIYSITAGGTEDNPFFEIKFGKTKIRCETFKDNPDFDIFEVLVNEKQRLIMSGSGEFTILDDNGQVRIKEKADGSGYTANANGKRIFEHTGVSTTMRSNGTANSFIKIEDTSVYVWVNGIEREHWV